MPYFTVRVKLEVETELRREIYAPISISFSYTMCFCLYSVFLIRDMGKIAEELMVMNCGVGDSWESPGLQGNPTSRS